MKDNGIYYFLGNIPSHISHALPLYEKIGGTFVVLSKKSKEALHSYNVPVVCIDDCPDVFLKLDITVKNTIRYVNKHAKIVLFYEIFQYPKLYKISRPVSLFLTHGNMLKSYMTANPMRLRALKDYSYMAALSPHLKREFLEDDGIPPSKLVDIGIARTDKVVEHKGKVHGYKTIARKLNLDPNKPLITYMPTYWGGSSVHHIGKEFLRRLPEDYNLIFRPHPQTPTYIIEVYEAIIEKKQNIRYAPDSLDKDINMLSLFNASSIIAGDVSSVMLESILTDKPLLFLGITGREQLENKDLSSIKELVEYSGRINKNNLDQSAFIIKNSLLRGIDNEIWKKTKDRVFFHYDGTSVESIVDFIQTTLNKKI